MMRKIKSGQMLYLLNATKRIEQGLPTAPKKQESLKRIVETKFHALDIKVAAMAANIEQLKHDVEGKTSSHNDEMPPMTTWFQIMPRFVVVVVPPLNLL
ncbi:Aspartic proteinase nepenthesin-1 [Hordeum vulgare]|nr:Aspartic proteinase nepenthesin-1 [Hordeum vulgare]